MAQGFKLVLRPSKPGEKDSEKKFYAISVSSDGVTDKKDFNSSMLRPPRIIFTPGGELKDTKKTLEYSRISQDGTTAEAGGSDSDSPSEI